jgi:hypothetical protein
LFWTQNATFHFFICRGEWVASHSLREWVGNAECSTLEGHKITHSRREATHRSWLSAIFERKKKETSFLTAVIDKNLESKMKYKKLSVEKGFLCL